MQSGANLKLGEDFLRASVGAAALDVANLIVPGSALAVVFIEHFGGAFCKAAWDWLRRRKPPECQQAIDELTRTQVERARVIAETELVRSEFKPDVKAGLVNYLSAIPMTARRAISRPDDEGRPTTLLSQLPRRPSDLRRFIPLRPPRFQPGDQVPGHDYRLDLLLGQGGFAEVWKAHHIYREKQPPVALKFCLDPALLVSLRMEIKVLDILSGPERSEDFVHLLDTAYSAEPPFLVYEYVDGGDLEAWLASFDGKQPSAPDVVRVLRMTAHALAFAHQNHIVHRDLKPANLLVTRQGRIKVADFGIGAISANAEAEQRSITGVSILQEAFTPHYADPLMPPGKSADPKVDVYALGVIAYQLLTGTVSRSIVPAWRAELQQRNVPVALLDIIGACVDIPEKRFADAGAVMAALDKFAFNQPIGSNYCIRCGLKIQSDDRFCIRCGFSTR
jgi:hypothetical protein